jgi:single-strand DNA-binding protein
MINKATLLGRIGKKDYKVTRNGVPLCSLSMATNRKHIDSQGNQAETTTWHYVNFFNKLADVTNKYTQVGDLVYIEGEISHKKVIDSSGTEKWMYSIVGNEIKFIPTGRKDQQPTSTEQSPHKENHTLEASNIDDLESIPF